MKINIREDSVEIEGYVNAIERYSKPLLSRIGRFIERICKGAFAKAIKRNNDIHVLLNHDWDRDLGSTKQGNLKLQEDNIGLKANVTIYDKEVIDKARNGELVGWSFGFSDREVENSIDNSTGMPTRAVRDLDLYEVSILDKRKIPAYDGTLICARAETGEIHFRGEDFIDEVITSIEDENAPKSQNKDDEEQKETKDDPNRSEQQENVVENKNTEDKNTSIDYSQYEDMIKEMKGDN